MHRLQEVIRLHRLGQSRREIAKQLRMGRNTIRRYQEKLESAALLEGSPDALPTLEQLADLCVEKQPSIPAQQASSVTGWQAQIETLHAKGIGPTPIHNHLLLKYPDYDGHLSSVKRLCRRLTRAAGPKEADVALRVETAPGEVAQVDFGYAGQRYDPQRGLLRKCWVFVMTLGFSRDMYCDLVFDQKIETWLDLHVRAFEHFGGVPRTVVPDNLKSAVIRASFGIDDKPILNRSYRELARHYQFQIDPTPPRSPEKKGKVESNVKYVRRNFLDTWDTVDIDADRQQLQRWVEEIAGQRVHGTTRRRPRDLFTEVEAQVLRALPALRWDPVVWKQVKVHRDSHVQIDAAYYSAPWKLLGKELWARCSRHSVELWSENRRVHTHGRVPRGTRQTFEDHLPEHRRDLVHRSRGHWEQRADSIGPKVKELVTKIFDSDEVLSQLRKVQAIVTHLETFPPERSRAAAARALHYDSLTYKAIKNILRKGLDLEPLPDSKPARDWASGSRFARQATFFSSS